MLKHLALKIGGVFAAILFLGSQAAAIPITGTITFQQPSAIPGSVIEAPAGQFNINFPSPMEVAANPTGSYAVIPENTTATFSNFSILGPLSSPTVNGVGGQALIWSVSGFTFTLQSPGLAVSVLYSILNPSEVASFSITGFGIATGPGAYEPTYGSFSLSGTGAGGTSFTFQSSETALGIRVPDGGTTALLLGVGLVSVGYLARRKAVLA